MKGMRLLRSYINRINVLIILYTTCQALLGFVYDHPEQEKRGKGLNLR